MITHSVTRVFFAELLLVTTPMVLAQQAGCAFDLTIVSATGVPGHDTVAGPSDP